MTTTSAMPQNAGGRGTRGPSLRAQLHATLGLYEALTKLYFVLIEVQTATAQAQARASLETQSRELRLLLLGADGDERSARPDRTGDAFGALKNLSASHAERVRKLAVVRPLLPEEDASRRSATTTASSSAPTIPTVAVAIDAVDEILSELVDRGMKHAANQARIETLVKGIDTRQNKLVATMEQLSRLREQAARLVKVGSEEEVVMKRAEEHPLDYEEVLRYGRTLSQTTKAPSGFKLKLDEEGDESEQGAEDTADEQANGRDADAQEQGGRKRGIISLEGAEGDGESSAKRAATQIPPHLQDKLPFPSVDAMRRSVSELVMPTWDQFQQGQLAQHDAQSAAEPDAGQRAQVVDRGPPAAGQMRQPAAQVRVKAPAEDEDEGFGLDLN